MGSVHWDDLRMSFLCIHATHSCVFLAYEAVRLRPWINGMILRNIVFPGCPILKCQMLGLATLTSCDALCVMLRSDVRPIPHAAMQTSSSAMSGLDAKGFMTTL